jgi:hypothetical protein
MRNKCPEHRMNKYNNALTDFLELPANLDQGYQNVITQIYPLRADIDKLQEFCNKYVNLQGAPVRFRPLAPWVLMQLCNYGEIALETQYRGTISQYELAFGFPVALDSDGVFEDWVSVYPFIYVDNPLSLFVGREVYGWSKAGMHLHHTPTELEPNKPRCLVRLSLQTETAQHAKESHQTFLEVFSQRPFLSGRGGVASLFAAVPRVIGGYLKSAAGILDTEAELVSAYEKISVKSFGDALGEIRSLWTMLSRLYGSISDFVPVFANIMLGQTEQEAAPASRQPAVKIITVKQFHDAKDPEEACYQAIVQSEMKIKTIIDAGLLFDPLSGDPTGGIHINMPYVREQPVVEQLGIRDAVETGVEGNKISTLRPLIPFWMKMNLSYGSAQREYWHTNKDLSWRIDDQPVQTPPGGAPPPSTSPPTSPPTPSPAAKSPTAGTLIGYKNTGSGVRDEVAGPVTYPNIIWRVFMLKAETKKLQALIDEYLENDFYKFSVTQAPPAAQLPRDQCLAYLVISNFDKVEVADKRPNPPGDRMLSFTVPVGWRNKSGKLLGPALIPLYSFVGTDWNYVTENEVYGRLAARATLASPRDAWMEVSEPEQNVTRELLTVTTAVFPKDPRMQARQPAQDLPLVRIYSIPEVGVVGPPLPTRARPVKADELVSFGLQAYLTSAAAAGIGIGAVAPGLDITGSGIEAAWPLPDITGDGFYAIALKQVRDAKLTNKAVYQSLVGVRRWFTNVRQTELSPIEIAVYKYWSMPIVEKMGLIPETPIPVSGDSETYTLKPVKSFSIMGAMHEKRGRNLCWRIGEDTKWTLSETFSPFPRGMTMEDPY